MINLLVGWSLSAACIVFLVSLPLSHSETGGKLRRVALAFLLLAFAPYLFIDLLRSFPTFGVPQFAIPGAGFFELIGMLAVVAPLAYVALALRRRLAHPSRDAHHARMRPSGKVPVGTGRDHVHDEQHSLFDEETE
jgi:hypothetical protein